jgi:hypothetical protein
MKRLIFIAALLISSILLTADLRDITIDGGTYIVNEGDTVRVYVSALDITENMKVIAFQFDAYYDEGMLKYAGHKPGDLFENAMLMANGENPGLVKVACSHWLPQNGSGTLIELLFIAEKFGESSLQFDKFKMNSTIMDKIYDASIKVLATNDKKEK